jgi:hypothetical protein
MSTNSSLELESLYKEFELTMIQYDQEYKNYLSILNKNSGNLGNSGAFVILEGKTYWGSTGLKEGSANTAEECKAMCSNDPKCSGATFKGKSKYCWTRSGEGEIMASSSTQDYAIITEIYQSASILYSLNIKVLDIIAKIKQINQQNQQLAEKIQTEKMINGSNLNNKYQLLLAQNREIKEILQQYQTVEEDKMNTTLKVRQHSLYYKIYSIICILLAYLTFTVIFDISNNIITTIYLAICLFTYMLDLHIISAILFILFFTYKMLE